MFETRLFVGNLPNSVQENELRSAFSNYGEVTNLDIKNKSAIENDPKKFAFVTISSANNDVESCIKYFSSNDFEGSRLYVTRARESFLERLQRERQQADKKDTDKNENKESSKKHPIIKLGDKLNPKKRKVDTVQNGVQTDRNLKIRKIFERNPKLDIPPDDGITQLKNVSATDKKKQEADKKRMESMQMKRQEFKNKQQIIKTGLIGIDKVSNKKLRFSDNEDDEPQIQNKSKSSKIGRQKKKTTLFDDDDESDDGVNFEIKKHYEGKKGQKVLDLQSRYKSDKRFVLDERFIEDDQSEDHEGETEDGPGEQIDVTQGDEKTKQIKILEDVLGVSIKSHANKPEKDRKTKPNMGMIRFDPMNPEHAKFVVPIEEVKQETKKSKKSKSKEVLEPPQPAPEVPKVEVSKEQFYKSEITKDAFEQPATGFSLRNLFARENDEDISKDQEQQDNYKPLQPQKQQKVKNPLDPGEKNPFVYDSSESEGEEDDDAKMNVDPQNALPEVAEVKAVWKENLFFSKDDSRLKDGLSFFTKVQSRDVPKERRELKSVMMKRIHNTERKNQMFRKKIGGRKKSMKKSYKRKS